MDTFLPVRLAENRSEALQFLDFLETVLEQLNGKPPESTGTPRDQEETEDNPPATASLQGAVPNLNASRHFRGQDYRDCTWNGERYTFTPTQAACVKVLWKAHDNGAPEVSQQYILETAGSESTQLKDVFKGSAAWRIMIVKGTRQGLYRLAEPT